MGRIVYFVSKYWISSEDFFISIWGLFHLLLCCCDKTVIKSCFGRKWFNWITSYSLMPKKGTWVKIMENNAWSWVVSIAFRSISNNRKCRNFQIKIQSIFQFKAFLLVILSSEFRSSYPALTWAHTTHFLPCHSPMNTIRFRSLEGKGELAQRKKCLTTRWVFFFFFFDKWMDPNVSNSLYLSFKNKHVFSPTPSNNLHEKQNFPQLLQQNNF